MTPHRLRHQKSDDTTSTSQSTQTTLSQIFFFGSLILMGAASVFVDIQTNDAEKDNTKITKPFNDESTAQGQTHSTPYLNTTELNEKTAGLTPK